MPLPPGVPAAFTEPVADPLSDLVARYARGHGPFPTAGLAARYGLGVAVITGTLRRLAAEGRVAEGEFLPGVRGTQWCDTGVLRMLRRRCLAKLRKEAEPAPPAALARFLPAWQNAGQPLGGRGDGGPGAAGGRRPRASADSVFEAIDQLAGAAVPASALETLILPGRVPGYQPGMLDELTAAGEVVWSGAGGLPGGDGWVALAPADTAPLLLPAPAEITMTPLHEAVLAALDGGGGLFFRMLADRATMLLPEAERAAASDAAMAAAVWDLVWAGRLTNDTLAALRTVLGTGRPVATPPLGSPVTRSRPAGRTAARRRSFGRPSMPARTGPPTVTGRWSLVPPADPDPTRRLHALARSLLDRYGILIRGTVAAERVPGGFAAIYPVLRAMEDAGQCRRGYFVEGLGAAQFALPGAVDRMRAMAAESDGTPDRPVGLATAGQLAGVAPASPGLVNGDHGGRPGPGPGEFRRPVPASSRRPVPAGSRYPAPVAGSRFPAAPGSRCLAPAHRPATAPPSSPWCSRPPTPPTRSARRCPGPDRPDETPGGHRPGRKAGSLVVLAGGHLVLYVERGGKTLLSWTSDPAVLGPAAVALAGAARGGALGRLTIERADGGAVYESPLARALETAGFRATPRGLRLRG